MAPRTILAVEKQEMERQLQARPAFADLFLTHMLTRNIRIEEDLIDQLFNASKKRLARTLLRLARYGKNPRRLTAHFRECLGNSWPRWSARRAPRVNFFMNKFQRLGFIEYDGGLKIGNSLLTVVLRD